MSNAANTFPLLVTPGVQRDGTNFASQSYIDSQWCRFYNGLPRKMGGYKRITALTSGGVIRTVYVVPRAPNFSTYFADADSLNVLSIDSSGDPVNNNPPTDITPSSFASNPNNMWTLTRMYSRPLNTTLLLAHVAPNLAQIDSDIAGPVYFGDINSTAPLQQSEFAVSGGIAAIHPLLFVYGSDGIVAWSQPTDPTTFLGQARISDSKVITMLATRGGNSSPAALIWTLDSVIRMTQVGTANIDFKFDPISGDSSILSSNCVVEYDGRYFWPGIDRFLIYTGIIQELPNDMSLNYFFSSLDFVNRQKVWGVKLPRWGEIWWFFPNKTLEGYTGECNDAVIYNVREQKWYDTTINRSAGILDATFGYPIFSDTSSPPALWMHEYGVDESVDGQLTGIPSWFETCYLSSMVNGLDTQSHYISRNTYLYHFEPDFKQSGTILLIVNFKEYANSPVTSSTKLWPECAPPGVTWDELDIESWDTWGELSFNSSTEKVDIHLQGREMTLRFVSADIGGDYEMGRCLIMAKPGDTRP